MVSLAELSLVARMAHSRSELAASMRELALIPVAAVAVLAVRAAQLRLVPCRVHHLTRDRSGIVLPANGRSVRRSVGAGRDTAVL